MSQLIAIGVSNFNTKSLQAAQKVSEAPIVVNQVHYNLIFREAEHNGLLQYCQENDIFLEAWRPVEKGILTSLNTEVINKIAKKYEKTAAQIAINWLISQPNVITLAKSSNPEHLEENLGSVGWELSKEDIEILQKNFPNQQEVSDCVPLS